MAEPRASRLLAFWAELKRRHVGRVAVAYAIIGYGVVQVATNFFPALQLPEWTVTFVAAIVVLGFPIALVLAWAYDIVPEGGPAGPAPDAASADADPGRSSGFGRTDWPPKRFCGFSLFRVGWRDPHPLVGAAAV